MRNKLDGQFNDRESQTRETNDISLESIFNEMNEVVWSASLPDFKLLFATPSIERLTGRALSGLIGKKDWWKYILHPEEQGEYRSFKKALSKNGKFTSRNRIIAKNGEEIHVHLSGKLIYDSENIPIRVDGLLVDRNYHHQIELSLKNELHLQKLLIELSSTYINIDSNELEAAIDRSLSDLGQFVNADRAYVFSYNFSNYTTSNTHEWCAKGVNPEIDHLQEVPLDMIPFWVEKHKQGEPLYVPDVSALPEGEENSLRSILEPQGIKSLITLPMLDKDELLGFVGFDYVRTHYQYSERERKLLFVFVQMLINIHKRQRNARLLIDQEERFKSLISTMNLGLIEVDSRGLISFANMGFLEMAGLSESALIGKPYSILTEKVIHSVPIQSNQPSTYNFMHDFEWSLERNDGSKVWWYISEAPGSDNSRVISVLDITLQKELEFELQQARDVAEAAGRAKELFLANMSHEIRTPLNVVIGSVRELMKQQLDDRQHAFLSHAALASRHLLTILNNVLDVSKIESGEFVLDKRDFDLQHLVSNVMDILRGQAAEKDLRFYLEVDPLIGSIHIGDEIRLRQVLINLVGNAIKFTNNGEVNLQLHRLNADEEGEMVKFTVLDTGVGMSEPFVQRIFDRFSQEQSTANRRFEGTGLGMSIANDIVRLMGSELIVESEKGKGTRCSFVLYLPYGDSSSIPVSLSTVSEGDLKGFKILLVEDNEMNRFIASHSLGFAGCDITEACNGEEAINVLLQNTFDLVLMDIQMPVMDGLEATKVIREKMGLRTPIIALTANAIKQDLQEFLQSGFNDYVIKPYDEDELLRKTAKYFLQSGKKPTTKTTRLLLYSEKKIKELSQGNLEFESNIKSIFVKMTTNIIHELRMARERMDFETIRSNAHKLKPSLEHLSVDALYHIVRSIEKYDEQHTTLETLDEQLNRVYDVLADIHRDFKN